MPKPQVRTQWTSGHQYPARLRETVRIQFLGCNLTAYYRNGPDDKGEEVWLDVIYFAEFLRDVDGLCAFCHGDPCGENSAPDSLIMREIAATPSYSTFETCPCCQGRPT
jgi:hypothetical protein